MPRWVWWACAGVVLISLAVVMAWRLAREAVILTSPREGTRAAGRPSKPPMARAAAVNSAPASPDAGPVDESATIEDSSPSIVEAFSYSGRVINARGQPVRGATVFPIRPIGHWIKSDTDGRFQSSQVSAMALEVIAIHPDYSDSEAVIADPDTPEIQLVLRDLAKLEGRVVDSRTGRPITKFRIVMNNPQQGGGYYDLPRPFRDSQGRFTLDRVHNGATGMTVNSAGYVPVVVGFKALAPGDYRPNIEVQMENAVTLEGKVVDTSGRPVMLAKITAFRGGDAGGQIGQDTSSDDGSFLLTTLPAGAVTLRVTHGGLCPIKLNINVTGDSGAETRVVMSEGALGEGTVTYDGWPMKGCRVSANWEGASIGYRETDDTGHFESRGIPDGVIEVTANLELRNTPDATDTTDRAMWQASKSVTVKNGRALTVNFDFPKTTAIVEGQVFDASGEPVAHGVSVTALFESEPGTHDSLSTSTEVGGRYRLRLPPGRGRIRVSGTDSKLAYARFEVRAGEHVTRDIAIGGESTLQATVTQISGTGQTTVLVFEGTVDTANLSVEKIDALFGSRFISSGRVSAEGVATIDGLEPGSYTVIATSSERRKGTRRFISWDAQTVVIEAGHDATVNLDLNR